MPTRNRLTPLRAEIMRRGLRQREVARLANIPENRLSDYCSGYRVPNADELERLERVLGDDDERDGER